MQDWRNCTLGDLLEIKHGFAFKGEFFSDEGPFVLLTPGNFREEGGLKLKGDKEKFYTGDFPSEFLLKRGDLLVAMTDLTQNAPILGSPAFIPEDGRFLHNQRLGKVVNLSHSEISPDFLFFLLNTTSVRGQIKGSATGATVRHTSPSRIYDVAVQLPPLPIQRRIAGILSAYDELIENSQRRIKILESMARALYREWFIHFRFPGHESVPRVPSPLGEIPLRWEVRKLPECVHINPRVIVPREGEKAFVPMGCLSNDSMIISDIESRAGNSGAKFQNGDTLFARITPCLENGKTGFVQFLPSADHVAFGSTEFIVLRSGTLTPEFVYCLARSDEFRGVAIKSMSGATGRQRVQEQCFTDFAIAQPPRTLLDRFSGIVRPSFRLIFELDLQIQTLRRTRDLLLPRLLSGQIDVESIAP
jgi:type I restriction enzyme S subunit